MMKTRFRILVSVLAVFMVTMIVSLAQAEIELRYGHYSSTTDTPHLAALKFKELVEQGSNGEIKINVHPASELGDGKSSLQGVRMGTLDITNVGNPYFTAFAPEMNVIDLPFLFKSPEHAYKVLDGEVGEILSESLAKYNMKVLALFEIGFRDITNNVKPIKSPADLKGLKLRTTPNPAHVKAFELLGANPTPMPFAELYVALQTGTVDGQENPVVHIFNSRLHEVQKYLSLTEHAYTAAPLVMNLKKFDSLDSKYQELMVKSAHEAAMYERRLNAELADESLAKIKESGVEVIEDPDVDAFRVIVEEPTRKLYSDQFGTELLDKIDALR